MKRAQDSWRRVASTGHSEMSHLDGIILDLLVFPSNLLTSLKDMYSASTKWYGRT